MKLTTLTEEQKLHISKKKDEYIRRALTFEPINMEKSNRVIEFVYSLIDKPMPTVHQCSSPWEAQKLANKLKGTKSKYYSTGTFLSIWYQSFYAFYDTFVDFGIIGPEFDKYFKLREFVETGIYSTIEFENAIIICEKPIICNRNDKGLHCITGSAIKWNDGYEQYYINGRKIDKEWFVKCLTDLTRDEFINEQNDEKRSAAYMIMGEERMLQLLGAELVDEVEIEHTVKYPQYKEVRGKREIVGYTNSIEKETIGYYRTKEKLNIFKKQPYAWRKVVCPSTGTNYLTPTDPTLKSAMEVAKFHRPKFVPKEVDYNWYSRS